MTRIKKIKPIPQPYQVGNLDGIKMKLGSGMDYIDYEVCPVWTFDPIDPTCKPPPKRDFNSRFLRFYFVMHYPTSLVLVDYKGDPIKHSRKKYYKESNLPNNQWVDVSVESSNVFNKNYLDRILINSTVETALLSASDMVEYHYSDIFIPTDQHVYGLQKYIAHPEWLKAYGYKYTQDLYIARHQNGTVKALIKCDDHSEYPKARYCTQEFIYDSKHHIDISAKYQSMYLKDWQEIQKKVILTIKNLEQ